MSPIISGHIRQESIPDMCWLCANNNWREIFQGNNRRICFDRIIREPRQLVQSYWTRKINSIDNNKTRGTRQKTKSDFFFISKTEYINNKRKHLNYNAKKKNKKNLPRSLDNATATHERCFSFRSSVSCNLISVQNGNNNTCKILARPVTDSRSVSFEQSFALVVIVVRLARRERVPFVDEPLFRVFGRLRVGVARRRVHASEHRGRRVRDVSAARPRVVAAHRVQMLVRVQDHRLGDHANVHQQVQHRRRSARTLHCRVANTWPRVVTNKRNVLALNELRSCLIYIYLETCRQSMARIKRDCPITTML